MDTVIGTAIRFTAPDGTIDVTLDEDNPAVRDLLTMLPMTLDFEDFIGVEKIALDQLEALEGGDVTVAVVD